MLDVKVFDTPKTEAVPWAASIRKLQEIVGDLDLTVAVHTAPVALFENRAVKNVRVLHNDLIGHWLNGHIEIDGRKFDIHSVTLWTAAQS